MLSRRSSPVSHQVGEPAYLNLLETSYLLVRLPAFARIEQAELFYWLTTIGEKVM